MSSTSAKEILGRISQVIARGQLDLIQTYLQELPLDQIDLTAALVLLSHLLSFCYRHQTPMALQQILNHFNSRRHGLDPCPFLILVLINPEIPEIVRNWILDASHHDQIIDTYVALVNGTDDQLAMAGVKALQAYAPKVSFGEWKLLLSLTDPIDSEPDEDGIEEEYPNPMLRAYFESQVERTAAIPIVPEWIREFPKIELVHPPITFPTPFQAVSVILESLRQNQIGALSNSDPKNSDTKIEDSGWGLKETLTKKAPLVDLTEAIIAQYGLSTMLEKIAMLPVPIPGTTPFDDTDLFRELGPVNTIYSPSPTNYDSHHICDQFGGCRMFTCTEFETVDLDGDLIPEHQIRPNWFSGQCDQCGRKIARRHHAVRIPLYRGGWKGCYCSCECLVKAAPSPLVTAMISRLKDQLLNLGIRDR